MYTSTDLLYPPPCQLELHWSRIPTPLQASAYIFDPKYCRIRDSGTRAGPAVLGGVDEAAVDGVARAPHERLERVCLEPRRALHVRLNERTGVLC